MKETPPNLWGKQASTAAMDILPLPRPSISSPYIALWEDIIRTALADLTSPHTPTCLNAQQWFNGADAPLTASDLLAAFGLSLSAVQTRLRAAGLLP